MIASSLIDKAVLQLAERESKKKIAKTSDHDKQHLTKAELQEEAKHHGYVLATQKELDDADMNLDTWKRIAAEKETEHAARVKQLNSEIKRLKDEAAHPVIVVSETTPVESKSRGKRDRSSDDDHELMKKVLKKIKKVKKIVKYKK